jgi:hypothetical protein
MSHQTRLIRMTNVRVLQRHRSIRRGSIALWLARLALAMHLTAGQAAGSVPPRQTSDQGLRYEASSLQLGRAIRGITIGPIENQLHPGRGYGSPACARTMQEVKRMGADWVSLTPFGRVLDIHPSGVAMSFEVPFAENRKAVMAAVEQAHASGLRVLLVPHLWVESGEWRGFIDPGSDTDWTRWAKGYAGFVTAWANVAQQSHVDMMAVGVELRRWLTTDRAPLFQPILKRLRAIYSGPLTYAANWDDVEDTVIWGDLDVIGINAFYPLATHTDAPFNELLQESKRVAERAAQLANRWHKPFLFTEFGYTTRKDPALRPWEWPEALSNVVIDERAQALAYRALLAAVIDQPEFVGLFAWRLYADPYDVSQEPEFGFSFRGKLAELELRDAFATHWAADGPRPVGFALSSRAHMRVADY